MDRSLHFKLVRTIATLVFLYGFSSKVIALEPLQDGSYSRVPVYQGNLSDLIVHRIEKNSPPKIEQKTDLKTGQKYCHLKDLIILDETTLDKSRKIELYLKNEENNLKLQVIINTVNTKLKLSKDTQLILHLFDRSNHTDTFELFSTELLTKETLITSVQQGNVSSSQETKMQYIESMPLSKKQLKKIVNAEWLAFLLIIGEDRMEGIIDGKTLSYIRKFHEECIQD